MLTTCIAPHEQKSSRKFFSACLRSGNTSVRGTSRHGDVDV
ncbi:hypothetical protein ACFPRL_36175 [Pseudoclavibacter helvolus]